MRSCSAWLWLTLAAAAPVAAQDPRLTERFPAAVAARLNLTVDSAAREGLPTDPLVLRALEGKAKGASTEQIIDALNRLHVALRTARVTLGTTAAPAEITTAAAALQAGMPAGRLQELHKLRGNLTLAAPLNAYLDLVARGAVPDRAWSRISDLARHRAPDADFTRLTPADVDHDPPGGHRPDASPAKERS